MSRPRPRGRFGALAGAPRPTTMGRLGGLARGELSRPTPGGGCPGPGPEGGTVSQHALRQTSPSRQLLLRAVCILLECILVIFQFRNDYLVFVCDIRILVQKY